MWRWMTVAVVLWAANVANAQAPVLSADAKDALEEIKDVHGEVQVDRDLPGHPVVGVKLRMQDCNPSTFKYLAKLDSIRTVTLWAGSHDEEYDFVNLKPLAGMKGLKTLVFEECLTDDNSACLKDFTKLEVLKISGTGFGDETMGNLAGLTQLTTLSVRGPRLGEHSRVSDKGLNYLRDFQKLRILDLCCTQVRGPGLARVGKLAMLEYIDLEATAVGNDDLEPIAALKNLRLLDLSRTKVTDDGLAHLSGLAQLKDLRLSYCGRAPKKDKEEEKGGDPSTSGVNDAIIAQFGPDGVPSDDSVHGISCAGVAKHLSSCKNLRYLEMKGQTDVKEPGEVRKLGRIWPKAVIETDVKTVRPE